MTKEFTGEDFIIYYPLKCNGKYVPTAYSLVGSLSSFSEPKDLYFFIKNTFESEDACKEYCKELNDFEEKHPEDFKQKL